MVQLLLLGCVLQRLSVYQALCLLVHASSCLSVCPCVRPFVSVWLSGVPPVAVLIDATAVSLDFQL